MDDLWTVRKFARWYFDLPEGTEPKRSQLNAVSRQCHDGNLPAVKICGSWRIDTSQILKEVRNA